LDNGPATDGSGLIGQDKDLVVMTLCDGHGQLFLKILGKYHSLLHTHVIKDSFLSYLADPL
jgi:hypothetical protein